VMISPSNTLSSISRMSLLDAALSNAESQRLLSSVIKSSVTPELNASPSGASILACSSGELEGSTTGGFFATGELMTGGSTTDGGTTGGSMTGGSDGGGNSPKVRLCREPGSLSFTLRLNMPPAVPLVFSGHSSDRYIIG